jgi:hypothetical protein
MSKEQWRYLCAVALACTTATTGAQAAQLHYVQASRASLRAQASAGASVLGYVTTNTELRIVSRAGDWCDVEVQAAQQRGFISCALLSEQKLTLEAIDSKLKDSTLSAKEQLNWTARAFWVAPSLARWVAAGKALEAANLSDALKLREAQEQKALRPRNAEFDAMKQTLERGIVSLPVSSSASPLKRWSGPEQEDNPLAKALRLHPLGDLQPSYFKSSDVLFAVPAAPFQLEDAQYAAVELVDALSSMHNAIFRVRVLGPAHYANWMRRQQIAQAAARKFDSRARLRSIDTGLEMVVGVWDVGAIGVVFEGSPLLQGITRKGEPVALRVESLDIDFGDLRCIRGPLQMHTKKADRSGPWKAAIATWVGKPAVADKAKVRTRQFGDQAIDKLVIDEIDLDGDGSADLSVWSGRYAPQVSAEGYWSAVFANVGGAWKALAYDQDDDCT